MRYFSSEWGVECVSFMQTMISKHQIFLHLRTAFKHAWLTEWFLHESNSDSLFNWSNYRYSIKEWTLFPPFAARDFHLDFFCFCCFWIWFKDICLAIIHHQTITPPWVHSARCWRLSLQFTDTMFDAVPFNNSTAQFVLLYKFKWVRNKYSTVHFLL